jgi:hypothetical protein
MFVPPPRQEGERQLQLELPDYSEAYERWIEKQKVEESKQETVIVIDIY